MQKSPNISSLKKVAIVGRPNVGKSRLFNRIAHRKVSIVHDKPGVTRDLVSMDLAAGFTLMDTGGIGLEDKVTPEIISNAMKTQALVAVETADLILFVTDAKEGVTPLDLEIGGLLHNYHDKIILVANKSDNPEQDDHAVVFAELGYADIFPTSAEHNHGIEELEEEIQNRLGQLTPLKDIESNANKISISLVGKPNAGKSSLGNKLLNSDRLIVSEVAGTTRDMVETSLKYTAKDGQDWDFRLFDTAGLRPKKKIDDAIEYFSTVRTQRSIQFSDIVLHLIDAKEGVSKQDKVIAGEILEQGKALIIVVTKWDYAVEAFKESTVGKYEDLEAFCNDYEKKLRESFFYLPDSPIVFTSSESGHGLVDLMEAIISTHQILDTKIPTAKLNKLLEELFAKRPPSKVSGKRFKIFYVVQVGSRPFRIKVFCNRAEKLLDPYRRYLEKNIVKVFDLGGCPFKFELIGKEERFKNQS